VDQASPESPVAHRYQSLTPRAWETALARDPDGRIALILINVHHPHLLQVCDHTQPGDAMHPRNRFFILAALS
jgi:hypothetical protein